MIFLKFPKTVLIQADLYDENSDDTTGTESRLCDVIMITSKYFQKGDSGGDTFVIICADSEGNIYEKFLNEVQLVESTGTLIDENNFKQNIYGNTDYGTREGAFEKSRRRKKNRKRPVPPADRKDSTQERGSGLDRGRDKGQANAPEIR